MLSGYIILRFLLIGKIIALTYIHKSTPIYIYIFRVITH